MEILTRAPYRCAVGLMIKTDEVSEQGCPVQATFHTDRYEAGQGIIPVARYQAITNNARETNHIERFNNTLRQRLSRLARETLSFPKKAGESYRRHQVFHLPRQSRKGRSTACAALPTFQWQSSNLDWTKN
jgi:hypothetical protein